MDQEDYFLEMHIQTLAAAVVEEALHELIIKITLLFLAVEALV
jgi:hypothetical protein